MAVSAAGWQGVGPLELVVLTAARMEGGWLIADEIAERGSGGACDWWFLSQKKRGPP